MMSESAGKQESGQQLGSNIQNTIQSHSYIYSYASDLSKLVILQISSHFPFMALLKLMHSIILVKGRSCDPSCKCLIQTDVVMSYFCYRSLGLPNPPRIRFLKVRSYDSSQQCWLWFSLVDCYTVFSGSFGNRNVCS